jgi:hypothetical protein
MVASSIWFASHDRVKHRASGKSRLTWELDQDQRERVGVPAAMAASLRSARQGGETTERSRPGHR